MIPDLLPSVPCIYLSQLASLNEVRQEVRVHTFAGRRWVTTPDPYRRRSRPEIAENRLYIERRHWLGLPRHVQFDHRSSVHGRTGNISCQVVKIWKGVSLRVLALEPKPPRYHRYGCSTLAYIRSVSETFCCEFTWRYRGWGRLFQFEPWGFESRPLLNPRFQSTQSGFDSGAPRKGVSSVPSSLSSHAGQGTAEWSRTLPRNSHRESD